MSKWHTYMDVQDKPHLIKKVSQRELLRNEIVIDYDDKTEGNIKRYYDIIGQLNKNGYKLFAFMAKGGRAKHIHIFDDSLLIMNDTNKKKMREYIINKYGGDTSLKIDKHMIPIEFTKHWKTGFKKELIYSNRGGWFDDRETG